MKPIVRWTIGNVSDEGVACLESSILNFIKIYKDRFQYYACYNNINKNKLNFLNNLKIECIDQTKFTNEIKYEMHGVEPFWKLLPPRINEEVHEIFIDNDLVIYKELEEIELFLNSNNLIICSEAIKRSYSPFIEKQIKSNIQLNTGFFGIYPKFNLKYKINETIIFFKEVHFFNEQGCLAYIFQSENLKIIEIKKISVFLDDIIMGSNGTHFVGLNRIDNRSSQKQIEILEKKIKIINKLKYKKLF